MSGNLSKLAALICAASLGFSASLAAQTAQATTEATGPSTSAELAERAYHNAQQTHLSGLQSSDGWYTLEGGLRWRYVEYRGTGDSPTPADTVTVHYAGTFVDGETFDSSYDRGTPATFPLSGLIAAWEMVIPQMRVGEVIELASPASLAYGPRGRGPIPGGATLLFKVELIGIEGR
ncbi:MAG: FKBP-type peptidyl-prolyl cis-trans isomerase [Erythrobacter sp.]|uniref:FKBP-type peptidyl-prolyl cis-trans isomerase n=1 Tax=Erythrobacter sp. TaxID=1042 RepID=UPI003263D908